jgi:hypothetical protein
VESARTAAAPAGPTTVPQVSGQPAPIPQATEGKAPPVSLADAESLAQGNDIGGCRDAAVRMRRAGVKMPAGLIALAALPEETLRQHR